MDDGFISQIVLLCLLIGSNAFFAASEIAFISLNEQKMRRLSADGDKTASLIYELAKEPSKFLATIQIGITLAGLLASAVAAESFADNLADFLISFNLPLDRGLLKAVSVVGITICLSYFSLVLGELVPKQLALKNPETICRLSIHPLRIVYRLSSPFIKFLSFSTNMVLKLFGINSTIQENTITEEEIRMLMEAGQEKGTIPTTEKEMIDNIFDFDDTPVSEIMTHRTDVVALPIDAAPADILDTVVNEKFSRIPIYQDTMDNIIGILHIRDLIPLVINTQEINLHDIIKEPYFVPKSKKNNELLRELQKTKTHMAVIVDEYGGTSGIVTIEDLLEEIVGSILDEHDEEQKEYEKLDESTYLIDGAADLEEVNQILGINLPTEDFETLNGLLIGELGRIPKENENPVIKLDSWVFKVEAVEDRRITKVRACKESPQTEPDFTQKTPARF